MKWDDIGTFICLSVVILLRNHNVVHHNNHFGTGYNPKNTFSRILFLSAEHPKQRRRAREHWFQTPVCPRLSTHEGQGCSRWNLLSMMIQGHAKNLASQSKQCIANERTLASEDILLWLRQVRFIVCSIRGPDEYMSHIFKLVRDTELCAAWVDKTRTDHNTAGKR